MQPDSKTIAINGSLKLAKTKFKSQPSTEFLGHALVLLENKCASTWHADQVCLEIPKRFDVFPSLRELQTLIEDLRPADNLKFIQPEKSWVSERAPGIPAVLEAICEHFMQGTIDKPYVARMIRYSGYPLDDLWEIYCEWVEGRLHPLCLEYKNKPRGALLKHLMEGIRSPLCS